MDVADCLWGSGFPSYEPCWFTLRVAPSQQDASLMTRRTLSLQFGGGHKKDKDMCVWGMEILMES